MATSHDLKLLFNERKDESEKKDRENGLRPRYKLDSLEEVTT